MTTFCSLTAWQWDEPLLHLGILSKRLIFCNKELKLTTDSQPVINKRDWGPPALSAHLMPTSKFCIWGTLEIMTTPPCSRKKSKYELMIVWSSETEQNRSQAAEWPSCPLMATILEFAGSRFSICGNLASLCGQALFVNWILSCLPKSEQKSFLCGDFGLRFLIEQSWHIFHLLCHRF